VNFFNKKYMYNENIDSIIKPSILEKLSEKEIMINRQYDKNRYNKLYDNLLFIIIFRGFIIAIIPRTNAILAILEPITLEIAISPSFFIEDRIPTISSGKLVPKATTVIPIIKLETLNLIAIILLWLITRFDP